MGGTLFEFLEEDLRQGARYAVGVEGKVQPIDARRHGHVHLGEVQGVTLHGHVILPPGTRLIKVAVLAHGIEDESLEGDAVLACGHQLAEVEEYIVDERTIAVAALEALQPGGQVRNGQLQQADLQRELHLIAPHHLQAAVLVPAEARICRQLQALDIRELEQTRILEQVHISPVAPVRSGFHLPPASATVRAAFGALAATSHASRHLI